MISHLTLLILLVQLAVGQRSHQVLQHALGQVNQIRQMHGRQPLCLNQELTNAAQEHANFMATHGVLRHDALGPRLSANGYHGAAAENIAATPWHASPNVCYGRQFFPSRYGGQRKGLEDFKASAEYANCQWYNSPDHFRNLISAGYNQIGIAYAVGHWNGRTTVFWVQDFGKSNSPCSAPLARTDVAVPTSNRGGVKSKSAPSYPVEMETPNQGKRIITYTRPSPIWPSRRTLFDHVDGRGRMDRMVRPRQRNVYVDAHGNMYYVE